MAVLHGCPDAQYAPHEFAHLLPQVSRWLHATALAGCTVGTLAHGSMLPRAAPTHLVC